MTIHKTLLATAVAAAIAFTSLPAMQALAASWDMPVPYGDNNFHTLNHKEFAKDVEKATDGKLKLKIHPSGSLYKHPEIKNAVRTGQVPIGEFLLSRLSNENALFQADSVPFLASSYDDAAKLWELSRPAIEKLLDEQGLMILYAVPWPPQGLYAKKEVNQVDDLKGVKFRAYNAATEQLARLADAVPTQVEVPDIPQAFSTGRVAAMVTSPSTGANSKAWDFLSHYHDTQAWLPKNVVVMNKKAFRRLDKDVQDAVLAAAKTAQERGWEASKKETAAKTKILKDNGVQIIAPSPELTKGLQDIGVKMTAEWIEKAGPDGKAIADAMKK